MAFDDLLRSLTLRTEAEVDALLATARERGAALRRASDLRCAERSAAVLTDRARIVNRETERALADAARTDRAGELTAQTRARDRILAAARARLPAAAAGPRYVASLPGRLAEALAALGDAPARLRALPALVPTLTRLLAVHPLLHVVPDATVGPGFAIESDDGRVVIDDLLEHRLAADTAAFGHIALRSIGGST